MKISTLWAVVDPTRLSEIGDICFEVSPEDLCHWAVGNALLNDRGRNLALYTEEGEAKTDALARLARRDQTKPAPVRLNVLDRARVVRYLWTTDFTVEERQNRAQTMPSLVGQTVVVLDVSDGHGLSYRVAAPNRDGARGREKDLPSCWVDAAELEPAPAV